MTIESQLKAHHAVMYALNRARERADAGDVASMEEAIRYSRMRLQSDPFPFDIEFGKIRRRGYTNAFHRTLEEVEHYASLLGENCEANLVSEAFHILKRAQRYGAKAGLEVPRNFAHEIRKAVIEKGSWMERQRARFGEYMSPA